MNVSSVSGLGGDWYQSFYNASKGAVSNLTRSLALELAPQGVRVNAVNPSLTLTEMTAAFQQHCRYATNLVSLRLKSSIASSDATISPPALDKRAKSARGTSC